jgi:Tfp pilus assembly protein PilF
MKGALSLLIIGLLSLTVACRRVPSEKEQQGAQIHHDLGVQALQAGDVQAAYKEFNAALELDPGFAEAHNAIGLLLHVSFNRHSDAIAHFKRALEIRPAFSEAKANLANVYLDEGRYQEAIQLYREVLNDMLYPTPYIAQGNLGWALYKSGDPKRAVGEIEAAVTTNPKFCLGYKNLGIIHEERGNMDEACRQFGRYRQACIDTADAYYREGMCLTKLGQREAARKDFSACQLKAQSDLVRENCRKLEEQLH